MNLVQVCGRLTKEPEMRTTTGGVNVLSIGVASNRAYKDKEGKRVEETEFHNVTVFGRMAENIQKYFNKGDEIYIQGRLKTSSWEKDGVKKYKTDIIGEKFEFGQKSKANMGGAPAEKKSGKVAQDEGEVDVEDIPM